MKKLPRPNSELITVAGFGCLVAAAWLAAGVAVGIAAIGVALLLTAWITEG